MEKHDLLPPASPSEGDCLRDLPPVSPLRPRLETRPQEEGFHNGCDCGCHSSCDGHEGCGDGSLGLSDYPLAMVYAPCQTFRALYDADTALNRGTLFMELDLPLGSDGCALTAIGGPCRGERRRV